MDFSRNIIFDKFLCIEGWAYRCRHLIKTGENDKIKQGYLRMRKDMAELAILLKVDDEFSKGD